MNAKIIARIEDNLLKACEDDWVALWKVTWELRNVCGENLDNAVARETTLDIVKRLLESGRVDAGDITADGKWRSWGLSPGAVVERIHAEWDKLGAEPDIGSEIVWLTSK